MKKGTVRLLLKLSAPLNVLFLVAIVWDYFRNASAWMLPLLVAYGAFLLGVLLLFFARPQAPATPPADLHPVDDAAVRLTIAQRP